MRISKSITALFIASFLALSLSAAEEKPAPCEGKGCAKPMMGKMDKMGMKKDMMIAEMAKYVNLTPAQNEQLKKLQDESKMGAKGCMEDMKPISAFIKNGTFDKEAFKNDRVQNMQKRVEAKADFMAKFIEILTPEQKTKLESFTPKHKCKGCR